MFHLPHNAIIPEEVEFILGLIDKTKEYYLYDDLKAVMFEQEIQQDKFRIFHPGMYKNFTQNANLYPVYRAILDGTAKYNDVKNIQYTGNKTLNGCWNEQARDYLEFLAFTGLLPSYYKGRTTADNEKRYYVGKTLLEYKDKKISYKDILFKMKFRNVSKNYDNIEQYNVRNRPFVVALKVMDILQKKGYSTVTPSSLSYLVRNIIDEDNIDEKFIDEIDFSKMPANIKREASRGATFFKRHLIQGLGIHCISDGPSYLFNLKQFNINAYNFKNRAVFIGDYYEDENLEVTPMLIKALLHPDKITDLGYKDKLIRLGMIENNRTVVDFNIDTDLPDRNLITMVSTDSHWIIDEIAPTRIDATADFKTGKAISESGNGTEYERFLYKQLCDKFGPERISYCGANTMAQRLSDIVCDLDILNPDSTKSKIKVIIEAKSGGAITAFDERKEIDDIMRTLALDDISGCNGIWYIVVDSNKIPSENAHGGFRSNGNQLSFKQKLLKIQSTVMQQSLRFTMVTAFSYVEFMHFLASINFDNNVGYVTKLTAPDFWTWSPRFITDAYVAIRA